MADNCQRRGRGNRRGLHRVIVVTPMTSWSPGYEKGNVFSTCELQVISLEFRCCFAILLIIFHCLVMFGVVN